MKTRGTPELGNVSDADLKAYLEPFGQEEDEYKRQMRMAEALRGWQAPPSYGLGAGIGNGLATALNGINGAVRESRATSGMADMLKREQSSALPIASQLSALLAALRQPQQPGQSSGLQADPYAMPPTNFGL